MISLFKCCLSKLLKHLFTREKEQMCLNSSNEGHFKMFPILCIFSFIALWINRPNPLYSKPPNYCMSILKINYVSLCNFLHKGSLRSDPKKSNWKFCTERFAIVASAEKYCVHKPEKLGGKKTIVIFQYLICCQTEQVTGFGLVLSVSCSPGCPPH